MNLPDHILQQIGNILLERTESIAIAESVTSGLLQQAFSCIPDASDCYKGGITAYAKEEKIKLLQVDPEEAERANCVSPLIAEQMAGHVSKLFGTSWGLATTGYATAVSQSGFRLYAYYSIHYAGRTLATQKIELPPVTPPEEAQLSYARTALTRLQELLHTLQSS
ncbi:MAG: hypothetical protein BGO09_13315 [Bacteroidetes bacterium 47-18]|nr:MAG: hypothetical protein BGO09_13315 [Bacteroidetes bacterium 47-18]